MESSDHTIIKPNRTRLTLIMVGICLAVFLTGMVITPIPSSESLGANFSLSIQDQTILATATPVISVEFNTS